MHGSVEEERGKDRRLLKKQAQLGVLGLPLVKMHYITGFWHINKSIDSYVHLNEPESGDVITVRTCQS